MSVATVTLQVHSASWRLRLTPTDVARFVRLEQCERFRLAERAGQEFIDRYGEAVQRLAPLLSLSGSTVEEDVEADLAKNCRCVNYVAIHRKSQSRPANNAEVAAEAAHSSRARRSPCRRCGSTPPSTTGNFAATWASCGCPELLGD